MIQQQQTMILSPYSDIYDLIVPKDNLLRQIKELVDFSFVYDELIDKYCPNNGRKAINPVQMFKYLLLKIIYNLSDVDVVERARFDMSFKYFLDIAPEAPVIEPSSLTKFRKLRLKDMNLLDLLINKTVEIALEKDIIKSNSIIVDSTHTAARYNQKAPREVLVDQAKNLRKAVYSVDENMKSKFPTKNTTTDLEDEIAYCTKLIETVEREEILSNYPAVKEKINILKELLDDNLEHITTSKDEEAKVGHKTSDSKFFGYKTHIAMTEERIITAAIVTTGEKPDGKYLVELTRKSKEAGMTVDTIIGDTAYSGKDNLEFTKQNKIRLVSRLHPIITQGKRKKEDIFEFNKDAGMYICKAGHMAISKRRHGRSKDAEQSIIMDYMFDVEKCKHCSIRKGCYRDGSKTKRYSVRIEPRKPREQEVFQNSDYFKEKAKERYKIEAKNDELKNRHGYDVASTSGLLGMEMQGALTIFAVNVKRIIKLQG